MAFKTNGLILEEVQPSILSLLQFTGRQAEAVTARDVSLSITAGAGSGKTRTLVGRYLALLAKGLPLRSLVAITFTEKAAREMRTRIRRYVEELLAAGQDSALWESAFAELDAARIGTIHSLCAAILRAHPAEAAVDPGFEVLEEGMAAVLRTQALDNALVWATSDPDAATLFALLKEHELRHVLNSLLNRRLDAIPAFAILGNDPLAVWSARLAVWLDERLAAPNWRDALQTLASLQASTPHDKLELARQQVLAHWDEVQAARMANDWEALFASLIALRHATSTGGAKSNWDADDLLAAREAMSELQAHYDAEIAPVVSKDRPVAWALDRRAAGSLPHLRRLFERTLTEYEQLKEARRALDFDDLEARAVALLENNAEVRARWQSEIRAVLVDEFQDTNERQRRIIYALTGFPSSSPSSPNSSELPESFRSPSSLFIVGDAKQSIYRFRGADVTVFRAVQADVAASGGCCIDLDLTFRAHRPLVEAVNALLRPILGEEDDPARPYRIPFTPLQAYRQRPRDGVREPFVEFHLGLGENAEQGRQAAAAALARRLHQLRAEGFDWGEMALLFRASTAFSVYEDALERAGIPFVTVAGRGFYNRPEVRDVLNALAAIADPADDLALAGLLRSPAFALTDAVLYLLRWGQGEMGREGEGEKLLSFWEALQDEGRLSCLEADDAARACRARQVIADLHELAGRALVAEVLKRFLDVTNYRAILRLIGGGERLVRNVDKLLADAHRSQLVSTGDFLEYVQTLRDVGAREGEAPVEAGGAVQLMTVHKAKGLEFPLVVIADAAHGGGGSSGPVIVTRDLGVVLDLAEAVPGSKNNAHPATYRLAAWHDALMNEAEERRLLYVAATRAREKLIFSGHAKISWAQADPGRLSLGGWLGWLGQVTGLDQVRLSAMPTTAQILDLSWESIPLTCVLYPLPEDTAAIKGMVVDLETVAIQADLVPGDLVAPPVTVEELASDDKTQDRESDPPPRVWRIVPRTQRPTGPAWVVGTLVHEALRRWRFPDLPNFEPFLYPYALQAGLTDPVEIAGAIGEARRLLTRFQAHPLYAEMSAAERYHEVPYCASLENNCQAGIVDALYRIDGQWTLVEFKTDEIRNPAVLDEHIRENGYDRQVQAYVTALTPLLGQQPRVLLVFLNCGGQVRVV
ncbi:MAG: UvrD-helicase domain-containing protein [Anaerolineae bacterium]|nr:UvrD-helicase domain-containing protein [Anaerolineae bacterium]MDH7472748.1 UvrD-helicase domain-containing protein [Anaerolineae bacterium]